MNKLINNVYDNITDYIDNSCIQETDGSWPSAAKKHKEILLLDTRLNNTGKYLKSGQIHAAYDGAISFNDMRKGKYTEGMILITVGSGESLKLIQLHVTKIKNDLDNSKTSVQIYQKSYAASWVVGCQACTITFTLTPDGLNIKMTGGRVNFTACCDYMDGFYFVPDKKMCIKF
jgi:hypothetical protein